MQNGQTGQIPLEKFWTMTSEERDAYEARLLDRQNWKPMPLEERKFRLEFLLVHTLYGCRYAGRLLALPLSAADAAALCHARECLQKRAGTIKGYLQELGVDLSALAVIE